MKLEAQIGVELSIVFVCTVMVFLRIWARYRSQARRRTTLAFILSDIFLFISLLMGITGDSGRALNLIRRIRARDDPTAILVPFLDLPESEAVLSLQIDFFNTISWMVILWCAKAAFLCAFLDVASVMSKAVRTYLYLVIGITALAGIVVLVLILTACVPLQAYWYVVDLLGIILIHNICLTGGQGANPPMFLRPPTQASYHQQHTAHLH